MPGTGSKPPPSKGGVKRTWQGRRARARVRKDTGGPELHSPPWSLFRFGIEHAPLAPPPGGIILGGGRGGGGYKKALEVIRGPRSLTIEEIRYLNSLGLHSEDPGARSILEAVQRWDAEIVTRLQTVPVRKLACFSNSETRPKQPSLPWTESPTMRFDSSSSKRKRRKS